MAAQDGLAELVRLMIAKGARVNARDNAGNTALHYAQEADIAQFLLSNGADVNVKSCSGSTPLHYVAARGHADVVQLLIDSHVAIDPKDERGQTPAARAMQAGHKEIVRLLAAHGAVLTLHMAAYAGDVQTVRRLLEAGAAVNQQDEEGRTPLYLATQEGYMEVMELLIARGADVNQGAGHDPREFAPLYVAASCGRVDAIDLLVRRAQRWMQGLIHLPRRRHCMRRHKKATGTRWQYWSPRVRRSTGRTIRDARHCLRLPCMATETWCRILLEKGADVTVGQMGRDLTLPDPRLQTVADMTQYVLRAYAPYTILVTDPAAVRRSCRATGFTLMTCGPPARRISRGWTLLSNPLWKRGPRTRRGLARARLRNEEPEVLNPEFAGFVDDGVRYYEFCQMIFFGESARRLARRVLRVYEERGVLRVIFDAEEEDRCERGGV